jgi:hypothetical protein
VAACAHELPPAIQVRETDVLVQNQTKAAWSGIEVWVNDHFRGVAPTLQPDQVLSVPLDGLVAAYGQRFDRHRQAVFGVLVTARASDGQDVRLTWGKVRRR